MKKLRFPDSIITEVENGAVNDCEVGLEETEDSVRLLLSAKKSEPRFIELTWNTPTNPNALFYGDNWERTYGEACWKPLEPDRGMPWYFFCKEDDTVTGVGVKVRPNSFVCWWVSETKITARFDVRCGGVGVKLNGRRLEVAQIVSEEYKGNVYKAERDFCGVMSKKPLPLKEPVYGGNNWYYAYGNSSREDILSDSLLQAELAEGLTNRPFMVIDDGWYYHGTRDCSFKVKENYGDMTLLAEDMKKIGVKPGIWVRLLLDDADALTDDLRLSRQTPDNLNRRNPLDPSHPKVLEHIAKVIQEISSWGYELIKHDFTTYDTFCTWHTNRDTITDDGWSFYDKTLTSAEVMKNFYKTILDAAGDTLILGCNTITHLSAGLVHLIRTGDDTSGLEWERTKKMGINSLAFRLPQHNKFYAVDADCVGIIPDKISWSLNSQWLKLLSRSGSPLFISCARGSLTKEQFDEVRKAYKYASRQEDVLEPIDWFDNLTPEHWQLSTGETLDFSFEE